MGSSWKAPAETYRRGTEAIDGIVLQWISFCEHAKTGQQILENFKMYLSLILLLLLRVLSLSYCLVRLRNRYQVLTLDLMWKLMADYEIRLQYLYRIWGRSHNLTYMKEEENLQRFMGKMISVYRAENL